MIEFTSVLGGTLALAWAIWIQLPKQRDARVVECLKSDPELSSSLTRLVQGLKIGSFLLVVAGISLLVLDIPSLGTSGLGSVLSRVYAVLSIAIAVASTARYLSRLRARALASTEKGRE